ncbi:hypothetical protein [Thermomonospora umbrina]|uniref:Uncharacterized protein n=1 Tax=Thermomonospora umbrina TaxID=111806 RepID=A0A3D9SXF0_9ACTN|nr:hypothetical protein [Thermomonospora umbrina]REE97685.1 hypothetical protein DFJ69_3159 [Thermomonospora umbrina]
MADPEKWRALEPLLLEARDQICERFEGDPNFAGAGIGSPIRGGRYLQTLVCAVFVVRKLPESELDPSQVIPRTIEVQGVLVETDVVEAGVFELH